MNTPNPVAVAAANMRRIQQENAAKQEQDFARRAVRKVVYSTSTSKESK